MKTEPTPAGHALPSGGTPTSQPAAPPRRLMQWLMHRSTLVALAVMALAVALGWGRMVSDADKEVDAALNLARFLATLNHPATDVEPGSADDLRRLVEGVDLRHVRLHLRSARSEMWFEPSPEDQGWLGAQLDRLLTRFEPVDTRVVVWQAQRGDAAPITVTVAPSRLAERREALGGLVESLLLLAACVVALLLLMRLNMAHALRPLERLLEAIAGIGSGQRQALRRLAQLPVFELERIAAALRQLADSLDDSQAQRRQLGHKLLTLQEDERVSIARELHDELSQNLTAMRVRLAWAVREVATHEKVADTLREVADDCGLMHQDIRQLLARLQPFGPRLDAGEHEPLARLSTLLRGLVAHWNHGDQYTVQVELVAHDAQGRPRTWPEGAEAEAIGLPHALALTLYRISQEALTNVARHAQASRAWLRLDLHEAAPGRPWRALWSVHDDGIGLGEGDATQRGRGLAGISERAWALDSDLVLAPAREHATRPGLRLSVDFAFSAAELPAITPAAGEGGELPQSQGLALRPA